MPRDRDDNTKFGMPPLGDPFQPFPAEIPWDMPISEMTNWWLEINSGQKTVRYPLRKMAGERGWQRTLREILPQLRDKDTGSAPDSVYLIASGGFEFRRSRDTEGHYHVLLGPPPTLRD